ncbi:MAG: DUF2062 domain-containing protein [Syntrophus sp. (in: bacteria)]|nr:DUF2062 domain-containing protein [Syntrophus sp. (in: bacteria)]
MVLNKRIQGIYQQFISLKGDPGSLARGAAMGVFVGATPTIPLHTVLVVLCGFLFKTNVSSACLGSWLVSNPLTIPLLYITEYRIGLLILGRGTGDLVLTEYSLTALLQLGWAVIVPLLVGGVVLAAFLSVPAYFLSYRLICAIREKRPHEIHPADSL